MNEVTLFEEKNMSAFRTLAKLKEQKRQLDAEEKAINNMLLQRMQESNIASVDNDIVRINLIPETESVSLDTKALRKEDPDLYHDIENRYNKRVVKKAHIRITVK
ncbi:MAG: hypothetical protein V8Q42_11175 [Anaerovoracaceae bacterium]